MTVEQQLAARIAILTRAMVSAKAIHDAMPMLTVPDMRRWSNMCAGIAQTMATIERLKGKL